MMNVYTIFRHFKLYFFFLSEGKRGSFITPYPSPSFKNYYLMTIFGKYNLRIFSTLHFVILTDFFVQKTLKFLGHPRIIFSFQTKKKIFRKVSDYNHFIFTFIQFWQKNLYSSEQNVSNWKKCESNKDLING